MRPQQGQHIPMQHYKLYYTSHYPGFTLENYVLLDVVYQKELPYWIESKGMEHAWLKTYKPSIPIQISTIEGLLGDKLTAFAPKTTGILYAKNRPLEIIKQLYDIATLFDLTDDLPKVRDVFHKVAAQEIAFRNLSMDATSVLDDAFAASIKICDRDTNDPEFKYLQTGIVNIRPHIFKRFTLDDALVAAAKAMYLNRLLRDVGIQLRQRPVK